MKNKIAIIGLLSVLVAGLIKFEHQSQAQGKTPHEQPIQVVVLFCSNMNANSNYGLYVYLSSSSEGAPVFPNTPSENLFPVAQALAELRRIGFRIVHVAPDARQFVLEK